MVASPATGVAAALLPRQTATLADSSTVTQNQLPPGYVIQDGRVVPWGWTRTGVIVKWSVFLGLLFLFTLYLFGGYYHARRRLRQGLKPLAYHRWLVSRRQLAAVDPKYVWPQASISNYQPGPYYGPPGPYGMQGAMPAPPPVYDPARLPGYDSAEVKIDPSQRRDEPVHRPSDFHAPPGPLPQRS